MPSVEIGPTHHWCAQSWPPVCLELVSFLISLVCISPWECADIYLCYAAARTCRGYAQVIPLRILLFPFFWSHQMLLFPSQSQLCIFVVKGCVSCALLRRRIVCSSEKVKCRLGVMLLVQKKSRLILSAANFICTPTKSSETSHSEGNDCFLNYYYYLGTCTLCFVRCQCWTNPFHCRIWTFVCALLWHFCEFLVLICILAH